VYEDAEGLPGGETAEIAGTAVVGGEAAVGGDFEIEMAVGKGPGVGEGNGLVHGRERSVSELAVEEGDHTRSSW